MKAEPNLVSRTRSSNGISSRTNSSNSIRRSASLSYFMSEDTLTSLSSLNDRPGLAFYTAYAHVKDVATHLSSITPSRTSSAAKQYQSSSPTIIGELNSASNNNNDPYALSTLLSCTLSSQELLLGQLYRSEVVDFRPGVDKVGMGLLISEIIGSFTSLLRVAKGLSGKCNTCRGDNNPTTMVSESSSSSTTSVNMSSVLEPGAIIPTHIPFIKTVLSPIYSPRIISDQQQAQAQAQAQQDNIIRKNKNPFHNIVSCVPSTPFSCSSSPAAAAAPPPPVTMTVSKSFLPRLADAASLGLLSFSSKSALKSVLALFDEWSINMRIEADDMLEPMLQLRNVLDIPNSTKKNDSTNSNSSDMPYHQLACTVSRILLKSHQEDKGLVHQSPHGPEDYTFQIPHVILEHFFWYIENVLLPHVCIEESGGKKSEVLILVGTILDVCTKVISIHELMLLADFHPLRVSVHGSSGFYSLAFHRIRSWFAQAYRATSSKMNLDQLHLCPELFVEETLYLQRLDRASASFRTLCFRHYALAQRTIGSNSMGSAGKSFEQMQKSFLPHPNQKSNTAKYRTHEYTNVKYASFVGLGTQAVVDDAIVDDVVADDALALDHIGYDFEDDIGENSDDEDSDIAVSPASRKILAALERSFVEEDVEAFVDLFDSVNSRIEHPPGTLPYLGTKVRAYFLNMKKRHPVFRSFKCTTSNDGEENIIIDVDADMFEGTAVQYQIEGECVVDKRGSKILGLFLEGLPDMSRELCQHKDQRLFAWTGAPHKISNDVESVRACEFLQETFRRLMAPAEILAYEMNKNKSGKNVSDGLTIVARSIVHGALLSDNLVQDALDQIARFNILLTAQTEVTEEGHYFVATNKAHRINLRIIEGALCRLDCDPYLNTQFNCDEGDMIRVIISKLGSSAEPSFELVTVMFHGICDAISVQDLHSQIIHRLALLAANVDHPGRLSVLNERHLPRTMVPPTIHHVKRALTKRSSNAAEPLPLPEPAPVYVPVVQAKEAVVEKEDQSPRSVTITRKVSVADTKELLMVCKRNNTTAHAAIGAASLLSVDCGESTKRVLTSAVDLRRRVDMSNSELVYSVGGFDGSAAFEYDMKDYKNKYNGKKKDDLWKLCHSIRNDLVDTIDSGRLLTTYLSSIEGLVEAYTAGFLDGGTFGTIFLSNIGNESYQKSIGPFQWSDFDYIYGQFLPGGPHYHITCSTFDGCMTLNFQYVSPTIPGSTATAFVESTMATLRGVMSM